MARIVLGFLLVAWIIADAGIGCPGCKAGYSLIGFSVGDCTCDPKKIKVKVDSYEDPHPLDITCDSTATYMIYEKTGRHQLRVVTDTGLVLFSGAIDVVEYQTAKVRLNCPAR